ncbi:heavy metal-binding protein HIP-like [Ruditapes philippinarum]|uniref:heavy metal-binding protein HIP-like n=1 Tax=Ruditapes philippinarum TaxID=129788 RepID=UPI00295C0EA3|nr:heavy metal-binding protein HIP-like [Ruditapes philippinarum]
MYFRGFVLCLWTLAVSALHTREVFSDDQMAASPVIQQLVGRMSVLESRDRNQQQKIDLLEEEIVQLLRNEAEKDKLILELSTSAQKYETETRDNVLRKREFSNEITVAFFAGLTHSIQHAGENQNVVFDHVETNEGNGYNPHHGVFTAPVAGIYVFTTSIMTISGRKICEVVVNGVSKAQVYTHGDGHYDHGAQTVIVNLKKGDDVAIQIVEHNLDNTIHGESPPYTTFSGFLLQQDFSGPIVGK